MRRKQKVYRNRPRKDGTYKPKSVPLPVQAAMVEEGRRMVLAYRLMLETGLRKNEVRLLAWGDLDLAAGTLTTRPEWEGNKNGKRETLPLPPGLVALLNAWREKHYTRDDHAVVKVTDRMLRNFDDDLVAAGIAKKVPLDKDDEEIPLNDEGLPIRTPARWRTEKRDAAGRVLDLHALRHTYGTRLVAAGVDIKTVQALMRHSSPELTLGIYVHADKGRMKDAVAALPDLGATKVAPATSQAAKRA
jgi:integrase